MPRTLRIPERLLLVTKTGKQTFIEAKVDNDLTQISDEMTYG